MKTSVALCTYNGEKYLSRQLDSILYQTVAVDEIIWCDDSSSDKTWEIAEKYKEKHPSVFKIFRNEKNLGYVGNFEKALSLCNGEIVFLCDQDDIWEKNKVEAVQLKFKNNHKVNVVVHNLELLENDKRYNYWETIKFNSKIENHQLFERLIDKGNIFPGMSMALKNKYLKTLLPLKKINHIIIHDQEIIIKATHDNCVYLIQETLGTYRLHENQSIGLKNFKKIKTDITDHDVYLKFKNIETVDRMIEKLSLHSNTKIFYLQTCNKILKDYLNQFHFFEKIYQLLRLKYIYKIKKISIPEK